MDQLKMSFTVSQNPQRGISDSRHSKILITGWALIGNLTLWIHNQTVAIFTLGMPIFIPQGPGNLEAIPRVPQGISGNVMFSFILF